MKLRTSFMTGLAGFITLTTIAGQTARPPREKIPYYFIAIHNEPFHYPGGMKHIQDSYELLRNMVKKADAYGIKLTLMFSSQWADFISQNEKRMQEVNRWKKNGHEIAGHHHSIMHWNWDGYTAFARKNAEEIRRKLGHQPEKYLGTLDDFMTRLRRLDPKIHSGCMNDEFLKQALPDSIIYDTCSGFANFGNPGTPLPDTVAEKGRNEFVSTAIVNGVNRKWLCHFQTTSMERVQDAKRIFSAMQFGVYGSVNHSSPHEQTAFFAWLDFLHSQDPDGRMCRTVSKVIEEGLLPENVIPDEILNVRPRQFMKDTLHREIRQTVMVLKHLLEQRRNEGADVTDIERLDRQSRDAMQQGRLEDCLHLLQKAVAMANVRDNRTDGLGKRTHTGK